MSDDYPGLCNLAEHLLLFSVYLPFRSHDNIRILTLLRYIINISLLSFLKFLTLLLTGKHFFKLCLLIFFGTTNAIRLLVYTIHNRLSTVL